MKTKIKALAAALTLLAAGQANAAINDDNLSTLGSGTGAGELFLSVVDRGGSSPESYVADLGALGTTGSILSNPSLLDGTSIAADGNLQSLLANAQSDGGSIYWQLTGFDNTTTKFGALSTSLTALNSSNVPQGFQGLQGPMHTTADAYVKNVNQTADGSTPSPFSANNSVIIPSSNSGAYYDGLNWGSNWMPSVNSEAGIGQSMGFYFIQATGASTSSVTTFANQWTLATDGTLTYGSPAPVPLPPAVWLLGSALVGLVGVGRRRTTAAV